MDQEDDLEKQIELQDNVKLPNAVNWEYHMRRQMQEVLPGLYLGPYAAAMSTQLDNLKRHGITHIICIRDKCEEKWIRDNMPQHFQYTIITLSDSPSVNIIPLFAQFAECVDGILSSGGSLLVHGNGGVSRSAALVASYIMKRDLISAAEALRFMQSKRFCVFPNEGFRRQLLEYEPILRAEVSAVRRAIPLHVTSSSHIKRRFHDMDRDEDVNL